MSVFSRLKFAKKAAKEHKAKTSKQINRDDIPKVPYKHVPTHAAVDALSGAPSSWKHEDRPRIMEHNKRRTMMSMTRSGSALSTRTWAEQGFNAPAAPSVLRGANYNCYNPSWNDRGDYSYLNEPYHKRKRVSRNPSFIDSGIGPSPLASEVASNHVSPSGSSNSSLTDENLEIAPPKQPQPNFPQKDVFDRLHTSTIRKVGEAPSHPSPPVRAPSAPVTKGEKDQKRKWTMKGKGREIAVAA